MTVIGTHFVLYGAVPTCQFGDMPAVFATFVSATEVTCVAPPHDPGAVVLEVANNGQDYTRSAVPFTYYRTSGGGGSEVWLAPCSLGLCVRVFL